MTKSFNTRLRQVLLLALVIVLGYLLLNELALFFPGIMGAVTLYILSRSRYFKCIYNLNWKKSWTAILFIIVFLVIIAIPVWASVKLISPKINELINNQDKIISSIKNFSERVSEYVGIEILTPENTRDLSMKISAFIPKLLNNTLMVVTNLAMMFFILYYLLVNGKDIELYLNRAIPLKKSNVDMLAKETKTMIKANALGIPIICIVQGGVAALGYWIFDVQDWGLWGFLTGVFAFFPVVGTMVVWVPIVVYILSTGDTFNGVALLLYSAIVTGNVDYLARMSLLKKMGDVHPMITVLGVIVGLTLFGFMGLVFGPLLVSYFVILVKIYINEFGDAEAKEGMDDKKTVTGDG